MFIPVVMASFVRREAKKEMCNKHYEYCWIIHNRHCACFSFGVAMQSTFSVFIELDWLESIKTPECLMGTQQKERNSYNNNNHKRCMNICSHNSKMLSQLTFGVCMPTVTVLRARVCVCDMVYFTSSKPRKYSQMISVRHRMQLPRIYNHFTRFGSLGFSYATISSSSPSS